MPSFIFGGNTGLTYEDLKRRREALAAQQAQAAGRTPQNVGEGLSALGRGIAGGLETAYLNRQEKKGRDAFQMAYDRAMAGPTDTGPGFVEPAPGAPLQDRATQLAELAGNPYAPKGAQSVLGMLLQRELQKGERSAPIKIGAGETLFDPNTGQPVFTGPSQPTDDQRNASATGMALQDYLRMKAGLGRAPQTSYQMLTPEQVEAAGLPPGAYQRSSNGQIVPIGGQQPQRRIVEQGGVQYFADTGRPVIPNAPAAQQPPPSSVQEYEYARRNGFRGSYEDWKAGSRPSTTVNVNTGDPRDGELQKALQKDQGKLWGSYLSQASESAAVGADLNVLEQALSAGNTGPIMGRIATAFPGIDDNATVAQAIISKIAPRMRVPGSGSTSDVEVQMMVNSLPSFRNRPDANALIFQAFRNKIGVDQERAGIIQNYQAGRLDFVQAQDQLNKLNQQSILPEGLRGFMLPQGADQSAPTPTVRRFNRNTGRFEDGPAPPNTQAPSQRFRYNPETGQLEPLQ